MQHTSVTTVIHCELKQEQDFPKQSHFFPLNYYCSFFYQEHYCLVLLKEKGQLHKRC